MKLEDFVEKGLLREANRLFFHPRGLALSCKVDDETNKVLEMFIQQTEAIGGFDFEKVDIKKGLESIRLLNKNAQTRIDKFGSVVQPIDPL